MSDTQTHETLGLIVGILSLQGDFDAHRKMLEGALHTATRPVRSAADLEGLDGLILPGGESTTIAKLMERNGLTEAVRARAAEGLPIYGTCAGLILLAKRIEARPDQPTLGLLDITVARNAFGRQVDSFEANIPFAEAAAEGNGEAGANAVRGVFIRAPYVMEAAPTVQILGHYQDKIVAVRQGHLLATAFHPELTDDARVHTYFLRLIAQAKEFSRRSTRINADSMQKSPHPNPSPEDSGEGRI